MLAELIARACSGAIHVVTGARALWIGCAPSSERRVYYGNHASHGDFVLIWSSMPPALRRQVRPVAAAEYWQRDGLRRYLIDAVFNGVLVEREAGHRQQDPLQVLREAVDEDCSLILFPEGTRNVGDEPLLPFKSGIYHLARQRPELEFVPVWIDNLKRVMPKGRFLPLPLLCTATFGTPLRLQADEDKAAFRPAADRRCWTWRRMEVVHEFRAGCIWRSGNAECRPADRPAVCRCGAVLVLATLVAETLRWRQRGQPSAVIANLVSRIRAWWVMAIVVGLALFFGRAGVIVLFAIISLFALREFITLAPTRSGDYYALLAAFYIVLPWQYYLVWIDWYGMYTLLIPVYAFLFLPILSTIGGDTTHYRSGPRRCSGA